MSDLRHLLESSPLAYRVLKSLDSKDATLIQVVEKLGKTKPSVSRVLHVLKRERLIEGKRNPQDGRSTIYGVPQNKKTLVRSLLNEVVSSQRVPKPFRAMPFAMIDLENLVIDTLKATLKGWDVTSERETSGFDVLLQRPDHAMQVGLDLRIGGEHFERHLYHFIGQLVAQERTSQVSCGRSLWEGQRPSDVARRRQARYIAEVARHNPQSPLARPQTLTVDRTYIIKELIGKIQQITSEPSAIR